MKMLAQQGGAPQPALFLSRSTDLRHAEMMGVAGTRHE
jgi:hypothetical protein